MDSRGGEQAVQVVVDDGGFNRIDELNDRIAAFIKAHATDRRAAQPDA